MRVSEGQMSLFEEEPKPKRNDCSRPCMWLELHKGFTYCFLKNKHYPECVDRAGYTHREASRWKAWLPSLGEPQWDERWAVSPCPMREECINHPAGCDGERGWCQRALAYAAKNGVL